MTRSLLLAATLLAVSAPALASDVVRHKLANPMLPIAGAVEVPAGKTLVFVSGTVPPVSDTSAPKDSVQAYGDTKTQATGALRSIEAQLKEMGLTMGDVVKMQVFLVGDPAKGGKMDFAGFTEAYKQFFGTAAQPNLPARSTMQVAGLVSPNFLVEIEVTAVRP